MYICSIYFVIHMLHLTGSPPHLRSKWVGETDQCFIEIYLVICIIDRSHTFDSQDTISPL